MFWLRIKWGITSGDKRLRSFIKGFIYEIIIAIPVLSIISFIFTGNWYSATLISTIYTSIKIVIYFIFEGIWQFFSDNLRTFKKKSED